MVIQRNFYFEQNVLKIQNRIFFWGVTTPTPLKKNLVPEISAVPQIGTGT